MKAGSELMQKLKSGNVISLPQDGKLIKTILGEMIGTRKMLGVYLTTTQPHQRVIDDLAKDKIDSSALFFLDMVGKESGSQQNIFILRDPTDFTELSVIITEVMENESIGFLMLDTIGGLESYSDPASVKKFLQSLVAYLKKLNKSLFIITGGRESADLSRYVSQVSDYQSK